MNEGEGFEEKAFAPVKNVDFKAKRVIDRLAKKVAKHGYQFEDEVARQVKRKHNPYLDFLVSGLPEEYASYYKWRTLAFFHGDSFVTWRHTPFQVSQPEGAWEGNGDILPEDRIRDKPKKELLERLKQIQSLAKSKPS